MDPDDIDELILEYNKYTKALTKKPEKLWKQENPNPINSLPSDLVKLIAYLEDSTSVADRVEICRAYLKKYDPVALEAPRPPFNYHEEELVIESVIEPDSYVLYDTIDISGVKIPVPIIKNLRKGLANDLINKLKVEYSAKKYDPITNGHTVVAKTKVFIPKKESKTS